MNRPDHQLEIDPEIVAAPLEAEKKSYSAEGLRDQIQPEFIQSAIAPQPTGQLTPSVQNQNRQRLGLLALLAAVLAGSALLAGVVTSLALRTVGSRTAANTCDNQPAKNLRGSNLAGRDLRGMSLCNADLSAANLRDTNLEGVNLSGADLRGTNLSDANLRHANLGGAKLSVANLHDVNLSYANLSSADVSYSNLSNANLSGASLNGTALTGTDLAGTTMP